MDNERKEFLSVLLGKLISLQDKPQERVYTGICSTLSNEQIRHVQSIWINWPNYSGLSKFPVPSPYKHITHGRAYFLFNRWSKKYKYGRMRHELLAFLIENVLKQIKELP